MAMLSAILLSMGLISTNHTISPHPETGRERAGP